MESIPGVARCIKSARFRARPRARAHGRLVAFAWPSPMRGRYARVKAAAERLLCSPCRRCGKKARAIGEESCRVGRPPGSNPRLPTRGRSAQGCLVVSAPTTGLAAVLSWSGTQPPGPWAHRRLAAVRSWVPRAFVPMDLARISACYCTQPCGLGTLRRWSR